eukprot:TRINITY_DN28728_c0_g1_i2.p1 TRINITY_DN28728_c0_g1~~TRINITY_DN28728_c0_g1_i2.p1  ORF type:complete len:110 (-),score=13.60 TRINITY_DN28728_c0_g1_i2:113-442(-)
MKWPSSSPRVIGLSRAFSTAEAVAKIAGSKDAKLASSKSKVGGLFKRRVTISEREAAKREGGTMRAKWENNGPRSRFTTTWRARFGCFGNALRPTLPEGSRMPPSNKKR